MQFLSGKDCVHRTCIPCPLVGSVKNVRVVNCWGHIVLFLLFENTCKTSVKRSPIFIDKNENAPLCILYSEIIMVAGEMNDVLQLHFFVLLLFFCVLC